LRYQEGGEDSGLGMHDSHLQLHWQQGHTDKKWMEWDAGCLVLVFYFKDEKRSMNCRCGNIMVLWWMKRMWGWPAFPETSEKKGGLKS